MALTGKQAVVGKSAQSCFSFGQIELEKDVDKEPEGANYLTTSGHSIHVRDKTINQDQGGIDPLLLSYCSYSTTSTAR